MTFHNNTIYMVSDFPAFGIWDGNVTIYITESPQDAADTMEALQEVLQVPISPAGFFPSHLNHRQLQKRQDPESAVVPLNMGQMCFQMEMQPLWWNWPSASSM